MKIMNCNEFYEDHKKNFGELLQRALQQNKTNIDQEQKTIIGLYTTFILQKIKKPINFK